MRTVGVVTVGRSDHGILRPVLRAMTDAGLNVQLFASGAFCTGIFGDQLPADGPDAFPVAARIEMLLASDTPTAVAKSLGLGVIGFAEAYERVRPEVVVLLGDRFEMLAAASAAVVMTLPLAHIHGGEITEGAIDDQIRHAITKMSHLHFVSTALACMRVVQMGEEPWRVTVSGAPGLDSVLATELLPRATLERHLGIELVPAPLLVTYHPVTLRPGGGEHDVQELLDALAATNVPTVITAPNMDASHQTVRRALNRFAEKRSNVVLVSTLGAQMYFSIMSMAGAIVGNSSSGIIEAASFRVPVVNVGPRQAGRERAGNVIDVPPIRQQILSGIQTALSATFRAGLAHLQNPYGDGHASARIAEVIATVPMDDRLRIKKFHS